MSSKKINSALIKKDLYQAVNGEWLKTAKIPADKPLTGGFADLADKIEKTLMADFANPQSVQSKEPILSSSCRF